MRPSFESNNRSLDGLLGELADDYARRLELGEAPDVSEYSRRHPELAEIIAEVFPALRVLHVQSGSAARHLQEPPPADRSLHWTEPETTAPCQPEPLGDYRIVREIGRGGMGVVYEAREQSLDRRVALKVLPFAAVLDARQLKRFKLEAQAAANLHHAHIVPVFSLGCERGVYYYAMQYIEGHPLSRIVEQLRADRGMAVALLPDGPEDLAADDSSVRANPFPGDAGSLRGSSHLTCSLTTASGMSGSQAETRHQFFRSVVNLGIQAAEGLQYAHEHGIVHRDIKPSNLLVTAEGHLWITDFGLAMMQSHPDLTIPGDLLGTLRYMSPEQALARRVPIDHRTDIYSLGVTLYELLTLEPAFQGNDRQELLRQIAFDEPRALRQVDPAIPRELETIIAKAVSKRPDDRYAGAQELADDLRRFLEDKPILAKPPTMYDRVCKWSRRHRSVVMTSALSLVVAVVGLAFSTFLVVHQRDLAREQHARAETHLQIARGNVDRMLRWMEMQDFSQLPYLGKLRQEVLEQSLSFHRSLLPEKLGDAQARQDAAQVHLQVGRIKALLGEDAEAQTAYAQGIDILEQLVKDLPDMPEYADRLGNAYLDLAVTEWRAKRLDRALPPACQATELFRDLSAKHEGHHREGLCRALSLMGLIQRDCRDLPAAQATLLEAVQLQKQLVAFCPQEPQHRVDLARTYRHLADVQLKQTSPGEAAQSVALAISIQQDLAESYAQDPFYGDELLRTRRWWNEVVGLAERDPLPRVDTPVQPDAGLPAETAPADRELRASPAVLAGLWGSLNEALRRSEPSQDADQAYVQNVLAHEKLAAEYASSPQYRKRLCDLHDQQGRSMLYCWRVEDAQEAYTKAMEVAAGLVVDDPDNREYRAQLSSAVRNLRSVRSRYPLAALVGPSKKSPEGVARAVELARGLDPAPFAEDPLLLLIHADYLILGNQTTRAIATIEQALGKGGNTPCFNKSYGLALLQAGRHEEAKAAFIKALGTNAGANAAGLSSNPDEWTAAYFADRITQEQFVKRWQNRAMCVGAVGCLPWFYIGMRMELEDRPNEARSAYLKAVEAGRVPNPHLTTNWAAYRLSRIEAERRATTLPAEQTPTLHTATLGK